jgi:hypothetical protein
MQFDWTAELRELVRDGYIQGFQNASGGNPTSIYDILLLEGYLLRTECSVEGGIRVVDGVDGCGGPVKGGEKCFESFEQTVHKFSGLAKKRFFEDLTSGFTSR